MPEGSVARRSDPGHQRTPRTEAAAQARGFALGPSVQPDPYPLPAVRGWGTRMGRLPLSVDFEAQIQVLPPFPCCGVVVLGRDEHIGGTSLLAERHSCPSASCLCSQPDCWFSRSCRLPTTSPLSPPHVRRRPLVPTVLRCQAECTAGTIARLATCLGKVVQ